MLKIEFQEQFKNAYKLAVKRGYDIVELEKVIKLLAEQKPLPEKYRDHELTENFKGCRECHITPDWTVIYKVLDDSLILQLMRTGTHSDLS